MGGVFGQLKAMRDFERRHLDFLRTSEDYDLLYAIGHQQELGTPFGVKHLFLLGVGSAATVQRRLARLRRLGVVQQRRCQHDRRSVELTLSPHVLKVFAQYQALLRGS